MANDLDLNEFSSSPYFKGSDLAGGPKILTICDVTVAEFSNGKRKPVLCFSDAEKQAALGPMNLERLKAEFGLKTSGWIGRKVMLMAGPEYLGNPTLHILPQKQTTSTNGTTMDIPF